MGIRAFGQGGRVQIKRQAERRSVNEKAPKLPQYLSVKGAAKLLGVCEKWLLDHLDEFPNWIRVPDAGPMPDDGVRIIESDIEKWFAKRN